MIDRVCGVRASLSIVSVPPLVELVLALSDGERGRTARIASLAGSDELGQRRLAGANVAIVGAGGLGSAAIAAPDAVVLTCALTAWVEA